MPITRNSSFRIDGRIRVMELDRNELIVLDSYALLCFLKDEVCAEKVAQTIESAHTGTCHLAMCQINLGEVFYILCREKDEEFAIKQEAEIFRLPIEFVETDWNLMREAALIKARIPMAFADCFTAALAIRKDASIMTGDPEFRLLENKLKIVWLERP